MLQNIFEQTRQETSCPSSGGYCHQVSKAQKRQTIIDQLRCKDGYCILEAVLAATLLLVLICTWCRFFRLSCWLTLFCSGIYSLFKRKNTTSEEENYENEAASASGTENTRRLEYPSFTYIGKQDKETSKYINSFSSSRDKKDRELSCSSLEDVSSCKNYQNLPLPQSVPESCQYIPRNTATSGNYTNISPSLCYKPCGYTSPRTGEDQQTDFSSIRGYDCYSNCQRFRSSSPPKRSRQQSGDISVMWRGESPSAGRQPLHSLSPCNLGASSTYQTPRNNSNMCTDYRSPSFLIKKYCPDKSPVENHPICRKVVGCNASGMCNVDPKSKGDFPNIGNKDAGGLFVTGGKGDCLATGRKDVGKGTGNKDDLMDTNCINKVTLKFEDTSVTFCPNTKRFVLHGSGHYRGEMPSNINRRNDTKKCVVM